jgi:hypothetical protein
VVIRYSRSPQNQREWLAQYPYFAHPAISERLTAGRDRPHSTGVESATQTSSNQKSLSATRSRIACLTSGSAARSRSL